MPQGRINPYIYDPSQQIRKDMGNAAISVEQGFQNVIDRKKQEYDYVNKAFEEIENTKKDLNAHNYELITKRSNDLIGELKNTIMEKGKVDFSKLGTVKAKVREIADAKRNSEISTQMYGEITKMIQANAAHMIDPIGTHIKIMNRLQDPKNLFSPKDLQEVAMQDYKDGIDYVKIGQEKLMELQKRGKVVEDYYQAEDGSRVKYKGVIPFGFKLDEKTKQLVPDIVTDEKTGVQTNPVDMIASSLFDEEQLKGFTKQVAGHGMLLNSNANDYVKDFISSSLGNSISYTLDASADKVRKEKADAIEAEAKAVSATFNSTPEMLNLDKEAKVTNIKNTNSLITSREKSDNLSEKQFEHTVSQDNITNGIKQQSLNNEGKGGVGIVLTNRNTLPLPMKYDSYDIKTIQNAERGGLRLTDKNGDYHFISKLDDIIAFRNGLPEKEREALNTLMSSPDYKQPSIGKQKPKAGKATVAKPSSYKIYVNKEIER